MVRVTGNTPGNAAQKFYDKKFLISIFLYAQVLELCDKQLCCMKLYDKLFLYMEINQELVNRGKDSLRILKSVLIDF